MAEARSVAVLGQDLKSGVELVSSEAGIHVDLSFIIPRPHMIWRKLRARVTSLRHSLMYTMYPFGPLALMLLVGGTVAATVSAERETSWLRNGWIADLAWNISNWLPWVPGTPLPLRVGILAAWVAIIVVYLMAFTHHMLVKSLLTWREWLYMTRKPTIPMKIWFFALKLLVGSKPRLYSFQTVLPHLPLPSLKATCDRYLRSARALANSDKEYEEVKTMVEGFLAKEGPQLQRYLWLKRAISDNYVSDWWEKYVYLRGRDSIMINSNYYCQDGAIMRPTMFQLERASVILSNMAKYQVDLEAGAIKPILMGGGAVPLCMDQFKRIFSTTRVPGRECDELVHYEAYQSAHVAVSVNGSLYKLKLYTVSGQPLTRHEVYDQLKAIKEDASHRNPSQAERQIAALTALPRTKWAEYRETHFTGGHNRAALRMIERAIAFVVLDDGKPETWTEKGLKLISGTDGTTVWLDKSISLVFYSNGAFGMNCEHAWADAPTAGHFFETCVNVGEFSDPSPYNKDGRLAPSKDKKRSAGELVPFKRVKWDMDDGLASAIEYARIEAKKLVDDFELRVDSQKEYGKAFIKKCKVSPDAYIQMALQLAYFRDQGRFDATYESAMTRLFMKGRTETIRPCTMESCHFVRTMSSPDATPVEKLKALQDAAKVHVRLTQDAMSGRGIDRHLFALYAVSVGKGVESKFLKKALSAPWRLSTSQQPQQQTDLWDINNPEHAKRISPGGGFGPVAADGYGVSYMVAGSDQIFFHISSKKSCPATSSDKFFAELCAAFKEMKEVFTIANAAGSKSEPAAKDAAKGGAKRK